MTIKRFRRMLEEGDFSGLSEGHLEILRSIEAVLPPSLLTYYVVTDGEDIGMQSQPPTQDIVLFSFPAISRDAANKVFESWKSGLDDDHLSEIIQNALEQEFEA